MFRLLTRLRLNAATWESAKKMIKAFRIIFSQSSIAKPLQIKFSSLFSILNEQITHLTVNKKYYVMVLIIYGIIRNYF